MSVTGGCSYLPDKKFESVVDFKFTSADYCRLESSVVATIYRGIGQLAKPTCILLVLSSGGSNFPLRSHFIRFSTGTYSFKLETDYNFCNEVKECVSAIRRFDWSHENIHHIGITLAFVDLPVPT